MGGGTGEGEDSDSSGPLPYGKPGRVPPNTGYWIKHGSGYTSNPGLGNTGLNTALDTTLDTTVYIILLLTAATRTACVSLVGCLCFALSSHNSY